MTPSSSTQSSLPVPTFESLGVRPFINCRGTYTIVTGSRALNTVVEAMAKATNCYVQMDELMEGVGRRLAELTGAEWGYVSSGCAAALAEITAAAVAGADPEKMARLPDTSGMKNEVIIQKAHRNQYDRAVLMAGVQVIEVRTVAELEAAINERTALIEILGGERGIIPVKTMIEAGRKHGIYTLVDAAAQRPDVPNCYLQMGADVVAYSGGKCLRGPQSSGLVLGRKDLLHAAFLHAAPHHGLCRPMKAGKEEIMGLLAAVEAWVAGRDHQAEWRTWEGYLDRIASAVAAIPSVKTHVIMPGSSNVAPNLHIAWDPQVLGCTPAQVHQELEDGDPAITLHLMKDGLQVMPYMMETGDDAIVAQRLQALLAPRPGGLAVKPFQAPLADLTGDWVVEANYVVGASKHAMGLKQEGGVLSGSYATPYVQTTVQGQISGKDVTFATVLGYQSNMIHYNFSGQLQPDGSLQGTVALDEFGSGTWTARRPS